MSNTQTPRRLYRGRSAAMLVGIATITESALAHAAELQEADSSFTEAYFKDLRARIDSSAKTILGADNAAALRNATIDLKDATVQATQELGLTKAWIESKYAANTVRRDELLNNLGFTRLYRNAVSKKKQEDLGQLLERVSEGLTGGLNAELTKAGLPQARVQNLQQLAATFTLKNVHQETQKGQRKERTAEDLSTLNGLFAEVMGVSKLAQRIFQNRPVIQSTFFYDSVVPGARSRKPGTPDAGAGNK